MPKVDYKKKLKHLYLPSAKEVVLVDVPKMNFVMVAGKGDPNKSKEFQDAMPALYGVTFTIKMMPKKGIVPKGYFEYTVPPLEGLWWTDKGNLDFSRKEDFRWKIMIMQPEFVTKRLVEETAAALREKKGLSTFSKIRFESLKEGLSAQIMHIGPYDAEPATIEKMEEFVEEKDLVKNGLHHEIYLSDPRRTAPEKLRTVLRQPVKKRAKK